MATPLSQRRRGEQSTPLSGRHTAVQRTPQSALTPNDDAAEKASVRRKKRSEALRKSLSDAFAGSSGDQQGKPTLSPEALSTMFEQCIKLAAENKITDKNVWQLDLIQHLPSIVQAGQAGGLRGAKGFNFQKMSGGLDAGVTIYSKRVDTTYKEVFFTLHGSGAGGRGDEDGDDAAGGDGEDDDDVEDAAAAAAKQAKSAAAGKRGKGTAAREEATLATAEALRQKKVDNTFAVDPLFHKMSALFDEGGAKGLLLLNRSVYRGAAIMTDPHEVPEQQFPLTAAAEPDTLINMQPMRRQLAACTAGNSSSNGVVLQLTPALEQMYSLLEQALQRVPGQQQQQQGRTAVDVAAIMEQATRGLAPTPMPARGQAAGAAAAARTISATAADSDMQGDSDAPPADPAAPAAADAAGIQAGSAVVAAFLAESVGQADEDAAAADGSWGDEGMMAGDDHQDDGDGHAGFEDEGEREEYGEAAEAWQQQQRRQSSGGHSVLGLGSSAAAEADEVLDAEALQQLLGGSGFNAKAAPTTGGGWAGSSFWKYKSAAAAIARLGGGSAATAKKAPAASGKARSSQQQRIDFEHLPELPEGALQRGSRKQTCLVTAATTAPTLLPQDLHYQASNLGQLFLKPAPVSCIGLHGSSSSSRANAAAGDGEAGWGGSEDGEGGWGGEGYEGDGDYGNGGADGYNAGDLSVGDPGYSSSGLAGEEPGSSSDWWAAEHELLAAPKRNAGLGVNYNRSAKQVDVRALKDLLWDSLTTVNSQKASNSSRSTDTEEDSEQHDGATAAANGQPTIPFQEVIVSVPEQSAAGSLEDVSVHMCFICLLHLANEKGLVIKAKEDLKTLTISNVS